MTKADENAQRTRSRQTLANNELLASLLTNTQQERSKDSNVPGRGFDGGLGAAQILAVGAMRIG